MRHLWIALCLMVAAAQAAWGAGLEMARIPTSVELKGDLGGRLDGSPWSSRELVGKVSVIFDLCTGLPQGPGEDMGPCR